ncbi:phage protein NinX family protein [Obesumbacterium proteus]|uniref:NinX family phage protein n=1 Tax=Obesumbacterium proteus ATCC 12841 TaxID=1354268 RepID=A0AA91ECY3_9GAMM|nr:phage protein NinX family protein [Obesumbacterium proteus]AMO81095.1 hypothetical protein DSM2777_08605 [Obesumbacterium proteus]AMO81530.1 hypothetical protein DSM2777_11110 [Obesumbacterium proteus]OAT56492.1 NinX family phage protein [Obesumbacterium proteus ATCC 12841]
MTDYSKMSDFEINCKVANALGMTKHFFFLDAEDEFDDDIEPSERGPIWQTREHFVNGYRPSNGNPFNPCNNPSDAWLIICESLISISPHYKFTDESEEYIAHSNEWVADNVMSDGKSFRYKDINPLRAAMIVYLMMKESENG